MGKARIKVSSLSLGLESPAIPKAGLRQALVHHPTVWSSAFQGPQPPRRPLGFVADGQRSHEVQHGDGFLATPSSVPLEKLRQELQSPVTEGEGSAVTVRVKSLRSPPIMTTFRYRKSLKKQANVLTLTPQVGVRVRGCPSCFSHWLHDLGHQESEAQFLCLQSGSL